MKKILLGVLIGVILTTGFVYGSGIMQRFEITNSEGEKRIELFAGTDVNGEYDNGIFQLYKDDVATVTIASDSNKKAVIGLRREDGQLRTWISEEEGVINGARIITMKDYFEGDLVFRDDVEKMINEAIEEALKELE